MANMGQIDSTVLGAMLAKHASVNVKLAVVRDSNGWRLHHGEVNLASPQAATKRAWHYDSVAFLELQLPGSWVAALLRGEPQEVVGLTVEIRGTQTTASIQRLRGWQDWGRVTTPWPRTEWTISRDSSLQPPRDDVLVGDDTVVPSFLTFDQALSAFFYKRPYDNNASRSDLWRIVLPQRAAWFVRIVIGPDAMIVDVNGEDLAGVTLELSESTHRQVLAVTGPGAYTFALPDGLSPDSFLVLRRARQWLDQRFFPALRYGRVRDDSVVWEQPGAELEVLLSVPEGQHLECKVQVPPVGESRRKLLKTIAAFASQPGGGTVLIGVDDGLSIVGLAESTVIDKEMLTVASMIRDNLEPEPPHTLRVLEDDGRNVLVIEVESAGRPCAYRNGQRMEFYVRRGPYTVFARYSEIAAGFQEGVIG